MNNYENSYCDYPVENPLNPKRVECSSFLTNSMGASDDAAV